MSLLGLLSLSLAGLVAANHDIQCTSTCLLTTFPGTFTLVPINLISETEVVGPTTIDAVDCITLGIPCESDYGTVSVESFTLQDGKLYEQNGLIVKFQPVEGLEENEYGVDKSSVLKAKECDGGCDGGFCVDQNGYLVSTKPLITDTGDYISDKIKIYACPNDGQEIFGGGDYKIFSNNVPNPYLCIPIYLGVNGSNVGTSTEHEYVPPGVGGEQGNYGGATISNMGFVPPFVTQIWDGQVQAPAGVPGPGPTPQPQPQPAPQPIFPQPAPPVQPEQGPQPAPYPAPSPVPVPAPGPEQPLPPLVSEIGDGQLQAPTTPEATPETTAEEESPYETPYETPFETPYETPEYSPLATPTPLETAPPGIPPVNTPAAPGESQPPTFQGAAARVEATKMAGWIIAVVWVVVLRHVL